MPIFIAHGHRPRLWDRSPTSSSVPPSTPALPLSGSDLAHVSTATRRETVRPFRLGFSKPKVDKPNPIDAALQQQTLQKIQQKALAPHNCKSGISEVNLNCQVMVRSSESSDSSLEPVTCLHLATMFAERAGKASEVVRTFATEGGIVAAFEGQLTAKMMTFQTAIRSTPPGCKHLFAGDQLGRYLSAITSELHEPRRADRVSQAHCLVMTADHVMALHVERKNKNGVNYFSAKLYDPNNTASYRRAVKARSEDFATLKFSDFMTSPELSSLYRNRADEELTVVTVCMDHRVQPPMKPIAVPASALTMHLALSLGVQEGFQSMVDAILAANMAPRDLYEVFQAQALVGDRWVRGLTRAFAEGHVQMVKIFTQAVLASRLSSQEKVDLLSDKRCADAPGLCLAIWEGHTEVLMTFVQQILASNLNTRDKTELLQAKLHDEKPALFVALEEGLTDVVGVFVRNVLSSNLNERSKLGLLTASSADGRPGLCMAMEKNHADAVAVFVSEVAASHCLSTSAKVRLLRAERSEDQAPGLFMALQDGKISAVQAFTQQILRCSKLDAQAKVELLTAKRGNDGTPGFFMAFQEGQVDAVRVFAREVLASQLSQDQKNHLLAARCSRGISGIQVAAHRKNESTISVFSEIVRRCGLSDAQKRSLLKIESQA